MFYIEHTFHRILYRAVSDHLSGPNCFVARPLAVEGIVSVLTAEGLVREGGREGGREEGGMEGGRAYM